MAAYVMVFTMAGWDSTSCCQLRKYIPDGPSNHKRYTLDGLHDLLDQLITEMTNCGNNFVSMITSQNGDPTSFSGEFLPSDTQGSYMESLTKFLWLKVIEI